LGIEKEKKAQKDDGNKREGGDGNHHGELASKMEN